LYRPEDDIFSLNFSLIFIRYEKKIENAFSNISDLKKIQFIRFKTLHEIGREGIVVAVYTTDSCISAYKICFLAH
jgi:hypothetical protein